jgi:hypothetical protein
MMMIIMMRMVKLCVCWISAEREVEEKLPLKKVGIRVDLVVVVKPTWRIERPLFPMLLLLLLSLVVY